MTIALEDAAAVLAESSDYRVLRRFAPRTAYESLLNVTDGLTGLYVDCETNGLDPVRDSIIELAIVPFTFNPDGRIYATGQRWSFFNDPGSPIPPEITALTGITDADVAGQSIDCEFVRGLLADAKLVVAHNADFDRRFMERLVPDFAGVAWGCSYRDVDWASIGTTSSKLIHILQDTCDEFYEAHRAVDDCLVGLHVLATARLDGRPAFAHLIDAVRQPTIRVWAYRAPFDVKDALKARGYHWNAAKKVWFTDVTPSAVDAEKEWLWANASADPQLTKLTARDRYSVRSDG